MKSLVIFGRQPALGIAELESLYGATTLTPIPGGAALLAMDSHEVPFHRLGGAIKLCQILESLHSTDWFAIEKYLLTVCRELEKKVPEGKLTIGLSAYGLGVSTKQLERTSLSLKKLLKATGRPVRIVPNKSHEISTPQVLHNKLTSDHGWELVLYRNGSNTIVARTTHIQDIEAYTARDQARPMRDSRVGMLPPKLAQILINLASAELQTQVVLDPFCGTGVVLQEAILMDFAAYGTDIEPRMIEYSAKNIQWLSEKFNVSSQAVVETADAISHKWSKTKFSCVACEGYLGLPFAHLPSDTQLQESIQSSNTIMKGFLRNLGSQVPAGFRACIGMPAWHVKGKVRHLPCLDQLENLGWKRVAFKHAQDSELIYHRDDQIVGRELITIVKT